MSLFIEMFLLLVLAGLIGIFLGWLLHGRCDDVHEDFEALRRRKEGGV